jgi:hypothetical protein
LSPRLDCPIHRRCGAQLVSHWADLNLNAGLSVPNQPGIRPSSRSRCPCRD